MSALRDESGRLQDAAESCRRLTDEWYDIVCSERVSRHLAPLLLSMLKVMDRQGKVIEMLLRERDGGK